MAIRSYRDRGTRDIAAGMKSKAAQKTLPRQLHQVARNRLAYLAAVSSLDDLRVRNGLNLHALSKNRAGQHAIRINDQYRVCFVWEPPDAHDVEITDYH